MRRRRVVRPVPQHARRAEQRGLLCWLADGLSHMTLCVSSSSTDRVDDQSVTSTARHAAWHMWGYSWKLGNAQVVLR